MSQENIVKNRSEILFLYDCKWMNPNGDPLEENRPRIDEETGLNIVTDVRLKRTIRDYLHNFRNQNIFIIAERKETGELKTREEKLVEEKIETLSEKEVSELLKKYIDLRLFGATIAVKNKTITRIGPVQFRFGRSLHKVEVKFIKGTTVLPSKEQKAAGTFTEMYVLPYSLICFYGVINENAAKDTYLTEDDVKLLLDGIWNGTKNLITRSKFGQTPRLLIRIQYKENNYHIGDLDAKIKLISEKDDREIRDISEVKIDISKLISDLKSNADKIDIIEYIVDNDIIFVYNGKELKGEEIKDALKEVVGEEAIKRLEF